MKGSANVTDSYNDGWYGEADKRLRRSSYNLLNTALTIGRANDGLSVKLWARNQLREDYAVALTAQSKCDLIQWAPPYTYGVTSMAKF